MATWREWLRRLVPGSAASETPVLRACVPPDHLVVAIGDIHGRRDLFEQLWRQIETRAQGSDSRHRTLVFLGDYVDRGPESAQLVDRLLQGFDGFDCVFLKGNHEEALLQFLSNASIGTTWENFGGVATLNSYGIAQGSGANWSDTRAAFAMALPEAHLTFYKNLRLHHAVGDYLFVHAGLRPYVRLEDQVEHDLLWIREEFLESDANFGQMVVHGHTPTREPVLRHNRIGIDTGACHTGKLTALVLEGRERHLLST